MYMHVWLFIFCLVSASNQEDPPRTERVLIMQIESVTALYFRCFPPNVVATVLELKPLVFAVGASVQQLIIMLLVLAFV